MFASVQNVWITLRGMNIYLEVPIAAFFAYFMIRHMMEIDIMKAIWIPLIVCFLGETAYTLQSINDAHAKFVLEDAFMILFMTAFQSGASYMMYSIAEKYGLIDKFGAMLGKKLDVENNTKEATK